MITRAMLCCLIAGPALADCPIAADLDAGIAMTKHDGSVEIFRRGDAGVIEVSGDYADGGAVTLLGQGVYVLEYWYLTGELVDESSRTTFDYPLDVADMVRPSAGDEQTFLITRREGRDLYTETLTATWGAKTLATYGDCTYTMVPGTLAYQGDGYRQEEGVSYLPELGVSFLASYDDTEIDEPESYLVVDIARVKE